MQDYPAFGTASNPVCTGRHDMGIMPSIGSVFATVDGQA